MFVYLSDAAREHWNEYSGKVAITLLQGATKSTSKGHRAKLRAIAAHCMCCILLYGVDRYDSGKRISDESVQSKLVLTVLDPSGRRVTVEDASNNRLGPAY